jgi:hypothetical protein
VFCSVGFIFTKPTEQNTKAKQKQNQQNKTQRQSKNKTNGTKQKGKAKTKSTEQNTKTKQNKFCWFCFRFAFVFCSVGFIFA